MSKRILAMLAVVACTPATRPAQTNPPASSSPAVAPPTIPVGHGAVVRPGATVWLDAGDTRPLQLPGDLIAAGLSVRVLAQHGDRLEVDTDADTPCATPIVGDFRLRMFVSPRDLREVSTAPLEHALPDGRRIRVSPGAIVDGSAAQRVVHVRWGLETIAVPVPSGSHGRSFDASSLARDRPCVLHREADGRESGDELDEVEVALAARAKVTAAPRSLITGGAQAFWRDGTVAGNVARDHVFSGAAIAAGARSCFALPLATEAEVTLCFATAEVKPAPDEPIGLGGIGTIGGNFRGEGGDVSRSGRRVPSVRQAKADVKGALDKDIIRRIVRAHINEIRGCYNRGLERDPGLKGRVAIKFVIGSDGSVQDVGIAETKMTDTEMLECIVGRIATWKFPKPEGGGNVTVVYPFLLESG